MVEDHIYIMYHALNLIKYICIMHVKSHISLKNFATLGTIHILTLLYTIKNEFLFALF